MATSSADLITIPFCHVLGYAHFNSLYRSEYDVVTTLKEGAGKFEYFVLQLV